MVSQLRHIQRIGLLTSLPQQHNTPKHRHKMKVFVTLALLALLLTMVMGSPFPKRKSDEENMDIYRKCRGKFGTSPKVECR